MLDVLCYSIISVRSTEHVRKKRGNLLCLFGMSKFDLIHWLCPLISHKSTYIDPIDLIHKGISEAKQAYHSSRCAYMDIF